MAGNGISSFEAATGPKIATSMRITIAILEHGVSFFCFVPAAKMKRPWPVRVQAA